MKKLITLCILVVLTKGILYSQNIGINATGAVPNSSAILDVSANNKGLLIPRVVLDSIGDLSVIALPSHALLVYNTNSIFLNGITGEGFYYNSGTTTLPRWIKIFTTDDNQAWNTFGNASTTNTNFIGTLDNKRLQFRVNNLQAGLIDTLNGSRNTAFGLSAGQSINAIAIANTLIGNEAGRNLSAGDYNVMIGDSAGFSNTVNNNNIMIGASAGKNSIGSNCVFIGNAAGYKNIVQKGNIAIGNVALFNNSTAIRNLAIGDSAGYENNASNSTFIGFGSGRNSNANFGDNTFIGSLSGYSSTTGSSNTFIGTSAGWLNTTGTSNIFIGKNSGQSNVDGNDNIIIGQFAAPVFTSGLQNVILGNTTTGGLRDGNRNIIVGYNAGDKITQSGNTIIGNNANVADSNIRNATAIGINAEVNANDAMVLGAISGINGATTTVSVGIGTQRPVNRLDDSGSLGLAIRTVTGNTTFTINDHTIILTSIVTANIIFDLPLPNTCKRREYVIVNHNAAIATRVFDVNYVEFNGTTPTIIPNGSITIQSDGISWYRIR